MTIRKMRLPRRTFLRGLGVVAGLPLLDAMVPALTPIRLSAAAPTKRFAAIYMPLGAITAWAGDSDKWTPDSAAFGFEYKPIVKPLEPYRQHVTFVSNMCQGDVQGDNHVPASWLAGIPRVKQTEAEDVRSATTLDQIIAQRIGQSVPFPSLELATEDFSGYVGACIPGFACAYVNTISWASPTTPLPRDINPRVVFERLFGRPGTAEERLEQMKQDRSILDSLVDDVRDLQRGLGAKDRARVGDYLDNVREIERRIQRTEAQNREHAVSVDAPIGIPQSIEEHIALMYDLMLVAYQTDLTRVITFMMGREISMRVHPDLGVTEPHHALSHHQDLEERIAGLAIVQNWYVAQFAKFVDKLKATPDGDGSMLDHLLMIYGSNMSNSNVHSTFHLPTLVVGGGDGTLKGDRFLDEPTNTPFGNLLVGVANRFDISMDRLGVGTGAITL